MKRKMGLLNLLGRSREFGIRDRVTVGDGYNRRLFCTGERTKRRQGWDMESWRIISKHYMHYIHYMLLFGIFFYYYYYYKLY